MTTLVDRWKRQLQGSSRPAYQLIPDLIADDLRAERLSVRDRLPTLRELASQLGLHYTTVARGFAEARKRGLIDSRTGAGSFVRGIARALPLRNGTGAEMTMNLPPEPADAALREHLASSAADVMARADWGELLRYQDFGGNAEDRAAAVHWLRRRLSGLDAERVLVCPGIHSVLLALVSQFARPGESICVDALAYPGLKAIASQLGVQLLPLPLDDDGPDIDALEHACRALDAKAIYCNPTLLNPTVATMSLARREALADVASRYSVPIIEDDAYAMLPRRRPPPIATFAPELTYYVTGMSKCLGAGLRVAYVSAPGLRAAQRLSGAMRATSVMASPVTNAIATRWIVDGTADAVLEAIRTECASRFQYARSLLGGHGFAGHSEAFHGWLPLPPSWPALEFASYARLQGAAVVAAAAFATDGAPPNAVRICLGGPLTVAQCEHMIDILADLLEHPAHPHATSG